MHLSCGVTRSKPRSGVTGLEGLRMHGTFHLAKKSDNLIIVIK